MKKNNGKVMKNWFCEKNCIALDKTLSSEIFGIIGESEKAFNCLVQSGVNKFQLMWIPKSVIIDNERTDVIRETLVGDFEEVKVEYFKMWKNYL